MMRNLSLALLMAGSLLAAGVLTSCGSVPVGPVDLSCKDTGHSDPTGCSHGKG